MSGPVTLEALDLAALLCSPVCHDLISRVGAGGEAYRNSTPIRSVERHANRQRRGSLSRSSTNSNSSGIPSGLVTSRQAPVFDRFRTVQLIVAPRWRNEITPPFRTRARAVLRFSVTVG
jgi:hypothetical protein